MPGMDGFEVCQTLKSNPRTQDIPIIFVSALDSTSDKIRAFKMGGVDYITKPFQLDEVVVRVETHLSLRRLQRNLQQAYQRMERELAMAAQVQESFMPKLLPDLPGWQVAASLVPAKLTSGDFYDIIRLPGNRLGVLIADVVDKGVGAALFMAMSSTLLRTYINEQPDHPCQVFHEVNQRLLEYTAINQFVTVFLGIIDLETEEMIYSNAGHSPTVLLSPRQDRPAQVLSENGPPLGVLEEADWPERKVKLASKDVLAFYTDGIIEAENEMLQFYGIDRLVNRIQGNIQQTAEAICESILAGVQQFIGTESQSDDIALIVMKLE
jgi:sigma-B regulation protein RsbU (phosphoserine phosphatase)